MNAVRWYESQKQYQLEDHVLNREISGQKQLDSNISHISKDGQDSGKTYQHFCNHTVNEVIYNDTPGYRNNTSEVSMKHNKKPMSENILTTPLQIMDPYSSTFENSGIDEKIHTNIRILMDYQVFYNGS